MPLAGKDTMEEWTRQANTHALDAEKTRNLPLISAGHHRALQLLLATEANDVFLTPVQRRNARTLQQHYHRQYLDTCLHRRPRPHDNYHHTAAPFAASAAVAAAAAGGSPSSSSAAAAVAAVSSPSSSSSTSSSPSTKHPSAHTPPSKSLLDRVRAHVDKALERKRTTRGFVSAISPTQDNMSDYTLSLKDLGSLNCVPELDIIPAPESLQSLRDTFNRHKAEAAVAAGADTETTAQTAQASVETPEPKDEDVTMTESPPPSTIAAAGTAAGTAADPPSSSVSSVHAQRPNAAPTTHSRIREPKPDRARIPEDRSNHGGPTRNGRANAPPSAPSKPGYSMFGDEEDDDEDRHDSAMDYRSTNHHHHTNGMDRPSKRVRAEKAAEPGDNGFRPVGFISAKDQLAIEEQRQEQKRANRQTNRSGYHAPSSSAANTSTATNGNGATMIMNKTLGTKWTKFRSPLNKNPNPDATEESGRNGHTKGGSSAKTDGEPVDERLRNIEPRMIEAINNEIMESATAIKVVWDDISGLDHAKKTIKETITWPMLRPDIFTGLRRPPKGLLLFGPPGTGKTMIGKCIASQSNATFFNISSASLTSKWVGDGEKMVRALFAVARCHQPAVIFMDEIDSLLTQRSDNDIEASRRIKTEFLVQFDGVGAASAGATGEEEDRILIIGATNRPQEIDEAARRRFQKRLYIPLPEKAGRLGLMTRLLEKQPHNLTPDQIQDICDRTAGYSGSDMTGLCREAALGPVRAIQGDILEVQLDALRPIQHSDFLEALMQVRASVSDRDLDMYRAWDSEYGSMSKS